LERAEFFGEGAHELAGVASSASVGDLAKRRARICDAGGAFEIGELEGEGFGAGRLGGEKFGGIVKGGGGAGLGGAGEIFRFSRRGRGKVMRSVLKAWAAAPTRRMAIVRLSPCCISGSTSCPRTVRPNTAWR